MAVVQPLAGVRFDATRVGEVGRVLAPPYDVISAAEEARLFAASPYNVVRLILPRETDRGAAAAHTLRAWLDAGILRRDPDPAVYLYSQEFTLPDGTTRRRDGVICRLRLEDFSTGVVRPHERTLPEPIADRLAILTATGANLSPIFGLYSRRGESVRALLGAAALGEPAVDAAGGHRLWRVSDPAAVARFAQALADETVVIADGHHRYATALAYRAARPASEAAAYVLAYLANMEEEGVVILPTHRLVRPPLRLGVGALEARLAESFAVTPLPAAARAAGEIDCLLADRRLRLRPLPAARAHLAGLATPLAALDVEVLHRAILGPLLGLEAGDLDFTHDDEEARAAVASGRAAAAFLLNPPTLAEVRGVCLAGELMPQKSTYFYPKLATGLVISLVGPPWV